MLLRKILQTVHFGKRKRENKLNFGIDNYHFYYFLNSSVFRSDSEISKYILVENKKI